MQNKKDCKKLRNEFKIRLYETEVIKSIDELMKTDGFASYNDLLGYAVALGIEQIYLERGKKRALAAKYEVHTPDGERLKGIERRLSEARVMQDDTFILLSGLEVLTSTIYNLLRAEAEGEAVSAELMDSGFFANLPDFYRDLKDRLIERAKKKTQKGASGNV